MIKTIVNKLANKAKQEKLKEESFNKEDSHLLYMQSLIEYVR